MKNACLLLVATILLALTSRAQEDKIETDRPGESQSTAVVEKGFFQAENGFRKEQQKNGDYSLFHPRTQLRLGLLKNLELRADVASKTEKNSSGQDSRNGLQPVELGLKAKIWEGKGALPTASFYTQVGIPNWASEELQKEDVFPRVRMLFENKLSNNFKLLYNAGAEWQGNGGPPQWLYTLQPELQFGDKWEAFAETYAYLQSGQAAKQYVDAGVGFYPHHNIKLDVWGGKGLSAESLDYFFSAGISFRFK